MWEDNGRQWEPWGSGRAIQRQGEKRTREGRHTSQQRETRRDTRGDKTFGTRRHHPTQAHMRVVNERQWEAMGDKTSGRARFAPLPKDFFPLQCRINSLAICSMLNPEAAISTIFSTFWNRFYGNCSILEQETDGKSSVVELETFILTGIGNFWS